MPSLVHKGLYRGPMPLDVNHVWWLQKDYGIRTILNLQTGYKELFNGTINDEFRWCYTSKIRFFDLDLSGFFRPNLPDLKMAVRILNSSKYYPLYVHCRHGRERTGLVVAAHQVARGMDSESAYKEMIEKGSRWPQNRLWKSLVFRDWQAELPI